MRKTEPGAALKPPQAETAEARSRKPRNPAPSPADKSPVDKPATTERRFTGLALGAGIAVGPAYLIEDQTPVLEHRPIPADAVEPELARLDGAVTKSRRQLGKLRAQLVMLPAEGQAELEPLIDAYLQMIGPSRLLRGARRRIEGLVAAETAVLEETEALAAAVMAVQDRDRAGLKRRADEIREIGRRLIRNLTETPFQSFAKLAQGTCVPRMPPCLVRPALLASSRKRAAPTAIPP